MNYDKEGRPILTDDQRRVLIGLKVWREASARKTLERMPVIKASPEIDAYMEAIGV